MLQVGLAVFGLVSLAVLAVSSLSELIAMRAVLGMAAAAMAPITNSLVFRLFDDEKLRMRAINLMMVVGMSGFVLGPLLGGTMLAHLPWQWLLLVNAPIALIAALGVHFGVPADTREGLSHCGRTPRPATAPCSLMASRPCTPPTACSVLRWTSRSG